jgi:hypothetical protein
VTTSLHIDSCALNRILLYFSTKAGQNYLSPGNLFTKEVDESGGFGANFIVKWKSSKEIIPPIIKSIMIGTRSGQGISFVSQGKVITEDNK